MYTSFIRPGLEYGSIVFCNCTDTEDEILESVQRRALKIITGGIVRTPTNNLYDEIGMETLKVRRDRNVLLFFFKIIHNMVPSYLQELKPEKQKPGRYMFRTKNDLVEPEWRITKYRKSFLPFATSLWNSLDENTRQITNYESFKDKQNIDPLTFSKKNPSRAIPRSTYIHPPSLAKIGQRTSEEIGNKQTDRQTDKQTNAARFIV